MKKFSQYLTPEEKAKNLSITEKAWLVAKQKSEAETKLQEEQKLQEQLDREEQERKSVVFKIKDINTIVEERIGEDVTEPEEMLSESDESVEEVRSIMVEGPPGPPGSQGDKGDTGEQGQGIQGPKGDKGDKGDRGDIGIQGFSGSNGEQGIPGSNGERGPQGDIGAVGPQGEKGDQGKIGPHGIQGIQGEKGDKGDKGDTGQDGLQGLKGDKGDIGLQGEIGPNGDKGDVGEKGLDGKDGKDGKDGRDGIDGKGGIDGKDGTTPDIKKLHEKIDKYLTSMNFGSGGGSGSYWLNDLGDTDYTSLVNATDQQVLTYDEASKKWIASTPTGGSGVDTIARTTAINAYNKANSANVLAQAAFDYANTISGGSSTDGWARIQANAAFDKANSANVIAQAAFDNSNTKFSSSGGTISGDTTVTGNLIINGTTTTVNTSTVSTSDSLLKLANNNTAGDSLDIGFYGTYNATGQKYAGLVRQAGSNFFLFKDLTTDPTSNALATGSLTASNTATLRANITGGTVSSLASAIGVADGGTGQTTYTDGQLLIGNTTGNTLAKATLTAGTGVTITNGAGAITIAAPLAKQTDVFVGPAASTTTGTYTAPANTQWVKITVVGPGGQGGGNGLNRATGGSAGGVAYKWFAMTAGQTLNYTVSGSTGTASTVSSGTATLPSTITANSGTSGSVFVYAASSSSSPSGGTATGGDINITGGDGGLAYGTSTAITTQVCGKGGDCPGWGTGGLGAAITTASGGSAIGYGAGGGGGLNSNSSGGVRAVGIIIFEAY